VERLYGCDGAVPHGRRRISIRAVEGLEERQRVESRGHEVNAPPVTGIGILKGMMLRVSPFLGRWKGVRLGHRRAIEISSKGKQGIAQRLGIQAATCVAPMEAVLGVRREVLGILPTP